MKQRINGCFQKFFLKKNGNETIELYNKYKLLENDSEELYLYKSVEREIENEIDVVKKKLYKRKMHKIRKRRKINLREKKYAKKGNIFGQRR